jgi:hypothetical protein
VNIFTTLLQGVNLLHPLPLTCRLHLIPKLFLNHWIRKISNRKTPSPKVYSLRKDAGYIGIRQKGALCFDSRLCYAEQW